MDTTVLLVAWGLCALVGGAITSGKGRGFAPGFFLGALLGLIGLIIAMVMREEKLARLTPAPAEGWHPDPTGRFDRRYFDGRQWTRHVTRDAERRQLEDLL